LMKAIEIFAILFLIILAYSFYAQSNPTVGSHGYLEKYITYPPFLIGLLLNCINFLQLPFWTGWNLYLINSKYISVEHRLKYSYIAGTLTGTFLGMLTLVMVLQSISQSTTVFSKYLMPVIIPGVFVVLAGIQVHKVYKKYF
jgi:hypothetical protein